MPRPCLAQSVKQGFCFSWDSAWLLQFTQEETSRKPEPQLKQTRSSTKETGHLLRCRRDPYFISSKLGFHAQQTDSGLLHAETKLKQIRNPTRKTHPPITAHLLNSTSTFSQDIRPGNASTTNQNPSSARLQLAKQGFCFSLGSDQPPRFAQEENSQKPEPQLKQTRSSTKETGHTDQTLHDPCHISSKLGFHFKGHAFRTLKPRPQA